MRYETVDTIPFTNHNNKTYSIKDRREYPDYEKLLSVVITNDDKIDELASRNEAYGDGGEDKSYKIVDYNIVNLFEADFSLSKINSLEIPV